MKDKIESGLKGGSQVEVVRSPKRHDPNDPGPGPERGLMVEEPKKPLRRARVTINIEPPFRGYEEGLIEAPEGCRLWFRPNGVDMVQFPDGSAYAADRVGFTAEAWQTLGPDLDTRSPEEQARDPKGV